MHLHTDNNVIQLLLTILFCCARWCWRENWWKWAKWADSITVSIIKAARWEEAPEQRERERERDLSQIRVSHWQVRKLDTCLTRQSQGREKKQRNEHQINVHNNKNCYVICISKYLSSSSANCCRTNDSFPLLLHSNRKKTNTTREKLNVLTSWD